MTDVFLYVYDLSKGLAGKISQKVLGNKIEAIWHTSIVAFDKEHYFAMNGYNKGKPQRFSKPDNIIYLGRTELSKQEFKDIIAKQIKNSDYKLGDYNLLTHNCNNFSNELSLTLFGKPNPDYIMTLPRTATNDLRHAPVIGKIFKPLYKHAVNSINQNDSCMKYLNIPENSTENLLTLIKEKNEENDYW
jgi:hypothetical protein